MRLIRREHLLSKVLRVMGTPDIKVITGIRRSGKSKLLEAVMDHVRETDPSANIIHVNFNLPEFDSLRTYRALYDHVLSCHKEGVRNLVFIDEVQNCVGFERAVNGLHARELFDIFITGSNAFLLSSDLATLFTGRVFSIHVYPFSFAEFLTYHGLTDLPQALNLYLRFGGMSGSYGYETDEEKYGYLSEVFNTLILRDVRQKYRINNPLALDRLANFMLDNIANLTSPSSLVSELARNGVAISNKTVAKYLEYLCQSFLLYKFPRYDIRGKKHLASSDKYYLADHAFRPAILGSKSRDSGRMLENIVAIELKRRGYEVYVGVLYKKEIDFVAIRRSEKLYIQVADNISEPETFSRELAPLLQIRDAYPKFILARTSDHGGLYEGVRLLDIATWAADRDLHWM